MFWKILKIRYQSLPLFCFPNGSENNFFKTPTNNWYQSGSWWVYTYYYVGIIAYDSCWLNAWMNDWMIEWMVYGFIGRFIGLGIFRIVLSIPRLNVSQLWGIGFSVIIRFMDFRKKKISLPGHHAPPSSAAGRPCTALPGLQPPLPVILLPFGHGQHAPVQPPAA